MGIFDTIFGNKKKKIEASLQKDPTVEKVLELASIYLGENDLSSALRLLRVWSKNFNDETMRAKLLEVEVLERKSEVESLEVRIKESPNSLNYSRLATLKIKSGELDDALVICKESLEKFPQFNSGAHQCIGDVYLIRENYEGAAKEYETVVKDDPNNFQAIKTLCEVYIHKGNKSKAISYLEDLIKRNPADQTLKDMLERAKSGVQLGKEDIAEKPKQQPEKPASVKKPITSKAASPIKPVAPAEAVKKEVLVPPPPVVKREPETAKVAEKPIVLKVTAPDGSAREVPLVKDEFIVGRHAEADLSIDDGKNFISRKHTLFKKVNGQYQVSDMGSGNGTFVNNQKITSAHSLRNKDIIKVGYYTLQFLGGVNAIETFDVDSLEDSEATIVGQEFSYLNQKAEFSAPKVSMDDAVNKVAKISGVHEIIVINSAGYPLQFVSNKKSLDEQLASALMSHAFEVVQANSNQLDVGQVNACDFYTDIYSIYLFSNKDFVVCVVGDLTCKKAQVDIEMKPLLQGLK